MAHRAWTAVIVITAVALGEGVGVPRLLPSDAERLQGTWIVTSVEKNGLIDSSRNGATVTFTGDCVVYSGSDGPFLEPERIVVGTG